MTTLHSPFASGFTTSAADDLAGMLKVLADPTRLKIVALLHANGTLAIHQLTDRLSTLKQPTVTHHVKILARAGLITKRKVGSSVECKLAYGAVQQLAGSISPAAGLAGGA